MYNITKLNQVFIFQKLLYPTTIPLNPPASGVRIVPRREGLGTRFRLGTFEHFGIVRIVIDKIRKLVLFDLLRMNFT